MPRWLKDETLEPSEALYHKTIARTHQFLIEWPFDCKCHQSNELLRTRRIQSTLLKHLSSLSFYTKFGWMDSRFAASYIIHSPSFCYCLHSFSLYFNPTACHPAFYVWSDRQGQHLKSVYLHDVQNSSVGNIQAEKNHRARSQRMLCIGGNGMSCVELTYPPPFHSVFSAPPPAISLWLGLNPFERNCWSWSGFYSWDDCFKVSNIWMNEDGECLEAVNMTYRDHGRQRKFFPMTSLKPRSLHIHSLLSPTSTLPPNICSKYVATYIGDNILGTRYNGL